MIYCARCLFPSTKPDLVIDAEGICSACRGQEYKDRIVDWNVRAMEWGELCAWAKTEARQRGNRYDCVVPISGGKDSTWQVVKCVESGLKVLGVSFEPTLMTPLGERNLSNLANYCDIVQIRKNRTVYRRLGLYAFRTVGDHDWPNHLGIFTTPVQAAVFRNIPLLIWGENCQLEYGAPNESAMTARTLDRQWLEEFGGLLGLRASDLLNLGYSMNDLEPYLYPTSIELERVGVKGVYLGTYFKWNAAEQTAYVKAKYGFATSPERIEGTYLDYENLDDGLVRVHDYFKYLKFGFGRTTDHVGLDIRHGRMERDEAIALVNRYDGELSTETVQRFCDHYRISDGQFWEVVKSFMNPALFDYRERSRYVHIQPKFTVGRST